ncbi:MAG: hypothetical protein R2763_00375 [Mycobacterium sp.]
MDRRMPVMDGLETTTCIRQREDGREVKIAAVTASVFEDQRGMDARRHRRLRPKTLPRIRDLRLHGGSALGGNTSTKTGASNPQSQPTADLPTELAVLPAELRT